MDREREIEVPVSEPRGAAPVWSVARIDRITPDQREFLWELRDGSGFGRSRIADEGRTWRRAVCR